MDFAFAKIEGTAGWYYNKWPGFLNVDAYKLMEAFSNEHLRTQEQKSNKRQRVEEPEAEDVVQLVSMHRAKERRSCSSRIDKITERLRTQRTCWTV